MGVGGLGVSGGVGLLGGTGVAVGGTGVAVGGTGVAVGGTGVAVGGTGVGVGGTGVGATKVTLTVESTESDVAMTIASSVTLSTSEVKIAVAIPWVVVLVTILLPRLPRVVVKVTTVPSATSLPYWSLTTAVSNEVETPSAGMRVRSLLRNTY